MELKVTQATKDIDDVDFSTGSVGLGVAMTYFASLIRDCYKIKRMGIRMEIRAYGCTCW